VYTLLIGAFIPHRAILGLLSLPALTLFSLYLLGLLTALVVATLFKKTFLKGDAPELLIELPPYRLPSPGAVTQQMADRAMVFLKNAGTIILAASIVLWFLASHPRIEGTSPSDQLQHSYAGWGGRMVEPVIRPLGFDWKIGIGLITSLLQREVFVSTMGTMYGLQGGDEAGTGESLASLMRADRDPVTGIPTFTVLTALCIMVYYVLSMQCLSTIAVMRRETNGWKWPLVQIAYMTALAYGATFVLYRVGTTLGIGG
jgi:ferrous iron transport protein B